MDDKHEEKKKKHLFKLATGGFKEKVDFNLFPEPERTLRKSLEAYRTFLAEDPLNGSYNAICGGILKELGDFRGALFELNVAIRWLDAPGYYYTRGEIKCDLLDYKGAIEDFTKAIGNTIETDTLCVMYQSRGYTKCYLEDYAGAIDDMTKIIDIGRYDYDGYGNRADVKEKSQDYLGAIEDFTKAIEFYKKIGLESYVYIKRANVKFKLGDKNGACIDWKKASELGNNEANEFINEHCK